VNHSHHHYFCRDANVLVGLPTTDVFVDSVEKRTRKFSRRSRSLSSQEQEGFAENVTVVDLLNDFISDLEPREKHLRVRCRVSISLSVEYEFAVLANRVSSALQLTHLDLHQINFMGPSFCSGCIRART